jgi:lantibiotic modifying enzyme
MNTKVIASAVGVLVVLVFMYGQYEAYRKDAELRQACEEADRLVKESIKQNDQKGETPSNSESFGNIGLVFFSRSEECQRVRGR